MNEKTLLKASITISVVTIPLLYIFSASISPKEIKIEEINDELIGQKVLVKGNITFIKLKSGYTILTIQDDTSKITVFYTEETNLRKGDRIEVIGRVKEYKRKLEIVASEINKK